VRTELFGLLDDDDELFADHLASLVALLARDADCDVAYSGVVKQEEDGLHLNTHARFKGDLGVDVPERRELKFMDDFSLDRLLRFDNFIQSNTWLARARVLVPELLDDPQLEVGEDMYFYLLLASRFRFRFSGRVTALWNWRSNAADNSMLAVSQARWARCGAEVIQRLSALEYPGGWLGREVLGRGRGVPAGPAVAEGPAVPGVAVGAAVPSKPRAWLKRALSLASGRRAFVAATEPIPFDAADVVCSIDFTQARWPELLVNARGLSDVEPWGSWTDGPQLTLEFRSALPPRLIVHLVGHAHASQHQRPLVLALGASEATLRMSARLRACRYTVTLDNPGRERSLVLRIPDARAPAATDPASRETRRLGVGLVRLDIVSA
jgi:phosphoglycerol transferase